MEAPVVVNLDWFEVYVTSNRPLSADLFRSVYRVEERAMGTRVWGKVFTLYSQGVCSPGDVPLIEVRCCPRVSSLFVDQLGAHIRLCNYYLYAGGPVTLLRDFCVNWGLTVRRIFRFDVCRDFVRFDDDTRPEVFVRRYLEGKYSKINQSRLHAHADDRWERRVWQSLSWGSVSSSVTTKLYNKTVEMRECFDKPYIREVWRRAGLRTDLGDVWRLEFSVRPDRRDGIHLSDLEPLRLVPLWESLLSRYFRFCVYQDGVRKDRCRPRTLFRLGSRPTAFPRRGLPPSHPKDFVERCSLALSVLSSQFVDDESQACISFLESRLESVRRSRYHLEPVDVAWMRYLLASAVSGVSSFPASVRDYFRRSYEEGCVF